MRQSVINQILTEYAIALRDHPDGLGEVLRAWAFTGDGYGCYSNFALRPEFEEVTPTEREFKILFQRPCDPNDLGGGWGDPDSWYIKQISWFKHPNGIEVGWIWDGDGTLCFYVPDIKDDFVDGTVYNTDCKKDHGWEFGYIDDLF